MKTAISKSINVFAKDVAAHLPGWEAVESAEPYPGGEIIWGKIKGPDGMSISFRKDGERVEVNGDYPRLDGSLLPWRNRPATISVGLGRDGKSVAKDIERRYLPAYEEAYRRGKKEYEEHTTYHNLSAANAADLAGLVNGRVYGDKKDHFSVYYGRGSVATRAERIEGRASANSIELKLEGLSPETARAILALFPAKVEDPK